MNEREIYTAALYIDDPAKRSAWLDEVCADEAMRSRIEKLLAAREGVGSFMEQPAVDPAATRDSDPEQDKSYLESESEVVIGAHIGPYKLLQKLGEGGMGVVFVAEQSKPVKRRVALKIIKAGMDSAQVIRRFEAERQALAMMDHSNIAKVLDAGTTSEVRDQKSEVRALRPRISGRPYFVMELVKGVPITKYCDELQLPIRERLELFVPVCQAIQHAHQKGIIHRDIKPSNVLVCIEDGKPLSKVIDFGVAKALHSRLTDQSMYTEIGQIIGTLEYMSPEQAELSALDIDTRADVYALGVLLYELLTGSTPLDRKRLQSAAYTEMLRIIKQEEPPKPSTRLTDSKDSISSLATQRQTEPARLTKEVRGDLDWIVMKCLEKDRTRRYASTNDLARDIQRYLTDEPVEACPPSTSYRLQKFWRKNKVAIVTASAFVLMLIGGACISTWLAVWATLAQREAVAAATTARNAEKAEAKQRQKAEKSQKEAEFQRDEALRSAYLADMRVALEDMRTGQIARLYRLLARYLPKKDGPDVRGWEWYYLLAQCHQEKMLFRGHKSGIWQVAWNPKGNLLASGGRDGTVRIWDVEKKRAVHVFKDTGGFRFAWSPDGKRLATAGKDRFVRLWDVTTGKLLGTTANHGKPVNDLAWCPDGKHFATASRADNSVKIWNLETRREIAARTTPLSPGNPAHNLAWSPDGRFLAAGYTTIAVWDVSGKQVQILKTNAECFCLSWSPDSKRLVVGSYNSNASVWEVKSAKQVVVLPHASAVESATWSPDGKRIATASRAQKVHVWDVAEAKQQAEFQGHIGWVLTAAWQPGGKHIASAGFDGTVRVWQAPQENPNKPSQSTTTSHVDSRITHRRAVKGNDGQITITDLKTEKVLSRIPKIKSLIRFWWFPDGKRLMLIIDGFVDVWDTDTGKRLHHVVRYRNRHVNFSSGYALMAMTNKNFAPHETEVWDMNAGKRLYKFVGHGDVVMWIAFSPDSKIMATACRNGVIKLWEPRTGKLIRSLYGHAPNHYVSYLAWSRDSRFLASGGWDQTVKVWEAASGKLIHSLEGHTSWIRGIGFSPDQTRLLSISTDGALKIWDAKTGREVLNLIFPKQLIGNFLVSFGSTAIQVRKSWLNHSRLDATRGYELADDPKLLEDLQTAQSVLANEASLKRFAASESNSFAWELAADPKADVHNPKQAVALARKAVDAEPKNGNYWNTLGVALYRNKDYAEAIKALTKSDEMLKGKLYAWNGFFLAMARSKSGNGKEARDVFARAVQWMEKHAPNDAELKRFRAEAEKTVTK